ERRHRVLVRAQLAAEGHFAISVARIIPLADWREAVELSQSQHPGGKIVLQIAEPR
ncbi:zinc-binding dehydrogenase, partial [Kibdelosporangium lantanae]